MPPLEKLVLSKCLFFPKQMEKKTLSFPRSVFEWRSGAGCCCRHIHRITSLLLVLLAEAGRLRERDTIITGGYCHHGKAQKSYSNSVSYSNFLAGPTPLKIYLSSSKTLLKYSSAFRVIVLKVSKSVCTHLIFNHWKCWGPLCRRGWSEAIRVWELILCLLHLEPSGGALGNKCRFGFGSREVPCHEMTYEGYAYKY